MSAQPVDIQARKCGHCARTLIVRPNVTFGQGGAAAECMECEGRRKVSDPAYGFEMLEREIGPGTIAQAVRAKWTLPGYTAIVAPNGMLGPMVCGYCGSDLKTWGHGHKLDRIDRAAPWMPDNVAACCQPCQVDRGAFTVAEWKAQSLDRLLKTYGRGCVPWENVLRKRCPPRVHIPNLRDYTAPARPVLSVPEPAAVGNDADGAPAVTPPAPVNKMQTIVRVLRESGPMSREDLYQEVADILGEPVLVTRRHVSANLCQLRSPQRLSDRVVEEGGLFRLEDQPAQAPRAAIAPPASAVQPVAPRVEPDHCIIITLRPDRFAALQNMATLAGQDPADEACLEQTASDLLGAALARGTSQAPPKDDAEMLLQRAETFVRTAEALEGYGLQPGPLLDAMRALLAEGRPTAEAFLSGRLGAPTEPAPEPEPEPQAEPQRVVDLLPQCAVALAELLSENGGPRFQAKAFAAKLLGRETGRGIAPVLIALRGRGWVDKGAAYGEWVTNVEALAEYMTAMASDQEEAAQ